MNNYPLHLIAFKLCPYVQRSVITLEEKGMAYKRTDIDLSNKPNWFNALSPTGKVPLLILDGNESLFESTIICEYLDETTAGSLLADNPLKRAQERALIEFSSAILGQISQLYSVKSKEEYERVLFTIDKQLNYLNHKLISVTNSSTSRIRKYFNNSYFSLVDAAFAPVFRYFEVLVHHIEFPYLKEMKVLNQWRNSLAERPSVKKAVSDDYHQALIDFVRKKQGHLAGILKTS